MLTTKLKVSRTSVNKLNRLILRGIANHFQNIFNAAGPEIELHLKEMVADAIYESPEAQSILYGRLHGELGLVDPEAAVRRVVELVQQSCRAIVHRVYPRGGSIVGGITTRALKLDFAFLLRAAAAKFKSEGGSRITWLEWLLERGTEDVVLNHQFVGFDHPTSRTGEGFMRYTPGVNWHVPQEFAGTHEDNWLTRALDPIARPVASMVQKVVADHIRRSGAIRIVP